MGSPVLWGPNNYANNLQNAELMASGAFLNANGPKNYITYGNFENQLTTGWSLGTIGTLTNGLPTGSPTFGSGASGNLSIAIVTSGQLSGTASLSYVSSAATTAGNMLASQAYTIDAEDQAKVLGFKFSYSAISNASNANWSGTSSNSFGVAVYDVTNSVFLGVAGAFNIVQSSGTGIATGTFQTGTTTASIRFIIYNVNATSGAITLYFDSFQVGPQVTMQAPAMSDWISFTPTGTWTANVTYVGKYRRVGDSYEFDYSITCSGAPTSATLILNLPSGVSIDTTKLALSGNDNEQLGFAVATDTGVNSYPCVVNYVSTTTVKLLAQNAAGTYALESPVTQAVPFTFGSTDTIQARFVAPIVGLSSNSVSSSDTDTRVIALQAYLSTNTANAGANTVTPFNTVLSDSAGAYSTSTNLYTIPVTGYYRVSVAGITTSAGGTFYIRKNSTSFQDLCGVGSASVTSGAQTILCNAGDTLSVFCTVSATFVGGAAPYATCLSIERLSGPAVITATESVNARYTNTSGQSIPASTLTTVTGWTKDFDSHNFVSTSGVATIPVSGKYLITFELLYASAVVTSGTQRAGYIVQAGSVSRNVVPIGMYAQATVTTLAWIGGGPTIINCLAGDTLTFQAYQTEATARSLSTDGTVNQICIARLGN